MEENKNNKYDYISFSKKQIFNERSIRKKDYEGNNIRLISISFPNTSKYAGWYISIDKNTLFNTNGTDKMAYTRLLKNANISIYQYKKQTNQLLKKKIPVREIKKEFESWQNR